MVENLRLSGLGLGNQGLVKNIQDVSADLLKLGLDLLAVLLDLGDMLVVVLRLLLLLNRGDDAPRGTAGTNNVLVGDGEKVALVDGKLTTQL